MGAAILEPHDCPFRTRLLEVETELALVKASYAEREQAWREKLEAQQQRTLQLEEALNKINGELGVLRRRVFGQRREQVEPVAREIKRTQRADPGKTQEKRRAARALRQALPERVIPIPVPEEQRHCPQCQTECIPLGPGHRTTVFEVIAVQVERLVHVQEKLKCPCCEGQIVTAPPPEKVLDQTQYGPRLIARVLVGKCADALPLNRQARQFERMGVPMARSTLGDLFRNGARLLAPLAKRIQELVAQAEIVLADETPVGVQEKKLKKTRRAYIWVFIAMELELVCYLFSPNRSGETPRKVLGASEGTLVVDAYTGYNSVCDVEGRSRAGCNSHMRRKFFEAKESALAEAQDAIAQILEPYRVEHEALERGIVGTPEHLALRQARSKPAMEKFKKWLEQEQGKHQPKGPLGKAISYALNQWEYLTKYLEDARIPIDNNMSERLLRVVALIRKNSLFVGNDEAGHDLATVLTLVGTCLLSGINPEEYLADVLLKVSKTPKSKVDELLPQNWEKGRQAARALEAAVGTVATAASC